MSRAQPLICAAAFVACSPSGQPITTQLTSLRAEVSADDASQLEGSVVLEVTNHWDIETEIWLVDLSAADAERRPIALDATTESSFPLRLPPNASAAATFRFTGTTPWPGASAPEGLGAWCSPLGSAVLSGNVFDALSEQQMFVTSTTETVWQAGEPPADPSLDVDWARLFPDRSAVAAMSMDAEGQTLLVLEQTADNGSVLAWLTKVGVDGVPVYERPLPGFAALAAGGEVEVLIGSFSGSLDWLGERFESQGSGDIFVTRLDDAGDASWSVQLGDTSNDQLLGAAVDGSGATVLALEETDGSTIDLGDGPVGPIVLEKLDDAADHVWSKTIGGHELIIEAAADGEIVLAGRYDGVFDLGGGPLGARGEAGFWCARLAATGDLLWSRAFSAAAARPTSIAIGPDGQVLLGGNVWAQTVIDFGDGPTDVPNGAFVVMLSKAGDVRWARVGLTGEPSVAIAGDGHSFMTGPGLVELDQGGRDVASYSLSCGSTKLASRLGVPGSGVVIAGGTGKWASLGGKLYETEPDTSSLAFAAAIAR